MGIPDLRPEPADKAILTFEERAGGAPEAVYSWFYPGDNYGVRFVYPKAEEQYGANAALATEPSAAAETPAPAWREAERVTLDGQPPVIVGQEEEEQVILVQAVPQEPPAASDDNNPTTEANTADMLPQTAGNFATIPLIGSGLLFAGFAAPGFANRQVQS